MNPYLEQESAWHDFRENFLPAAQDMLNRQIMPKYFAKIDEHVYDVALDPPLSADDAAWARQFVPPPPA